MTSILAALLFAAVPEIAIAQLYFLNPDESSVSKYDADTGALIKADFITGLVGPKNLVYANGAIFITQLGTSLFNGGFVGKYDAATGAPINPSLVSGLSVPQFVAVAGDDLLIGSFDGSGRYSVVGKYNSETGAVINRFFISIQGGLDGLAATQDRIYIGSEGVASGLASYDAKSGAVINAHLCPFSSNGIAAEGDAVWLSASVRYVGGATGGNTFRIDGTSGANTMGLMSPLVRGIGGPIAVSGDEIFIFTLQGEVRKYNASTGDEINARFITLPPGTHGVLAAVPRAAPAGSGLADAARNTFSTHHLIYLQALVYSFPAIGYSVLAVGLLVVVGALVLLVRFLRRRPAAVPAEPMAPAQPQPVPAAASISWRSVFLLMGGTFALLVGSVALVYEVALPMYLRKISEAHTIAYQQAANDAQAKAAPLPPPAIPQAGPPPKTLPAVLVDSYGLEDNWIAAMIANRLAELASLSKQVSVPADGFKIKADVQLDPTKVHLEISGLGASPVTTDLQPDFAWDAKGYAPLVRSLLGTVPPAETPSDAAPDEVTNLLSPTSPILAREDVTVSHLLGKHLAWPEIHEQAALLLVALAVRDRAGGYTDARPALSLATAHLAWARALRGTESMGWAGAIADAGIRALSGRERDALDHIDALAARSDVSAAAKAWLDAFRLRATDNWTQLEPTASTPLVQLITWSQALNDNLDAAGADRRLQKVGNLPQVSDFGHASISNLVQHSVQTDNQYCQACTQLDVAELSEALRAEDASPQADATVGSVLSKPLEPHLIPAGSTSPRVIGPDLFKDFARRHLLYDLWTTRSWLNDELGAGDDSDAAFRTSAMKQFGGMHRLENTFLFGDNFRRFNVPEILAEVKKNNQTWFAWELSDGNLVSSNANVTDYHPDIDTLHNFYRDGMPFGTVYNVAGREATLYPAVQFHKKQPPSPDGEPALITYPWNSTLQTLNPDSFTVFQMPFESGGAGLDTVEKEKRWWDYNLLAIRDAEKFSDAMKEDDYVQLLQKHAGLEPAAWFLLGTHLRNEGKEDEAADADRRGFEQDDDAVGMSNSVGPLVDYYLDRGKMSDAETVAKAAGDTGSECGLLIYSLVLEKEGRLKEALDAAKGVASYGESESWRMNELYAAHPDAFPEENKALFQKSFPKGLTKVSIDSFSGPPTNGIVITTNSPQLQRASLSQGDIVVALDGYKVESEPQYDYINAQKTDPKMDFIVWRQNAFLEVHANVPHRKFHVDLETYKPGAP